MILIGDSLSACLPSVAPIWTFFIFYKDKSVLLARNKREKVGRTPNRLPLLVNVNYSFSWCIVHPVWDTQTERHCFMFCFHVRMQDDSNLAKPQSYWVLLLSSYFGHRAQPPFASEYKDEAVIFVLAKLFKDILKVTKQSAGFSVHHFLWGAKLLCWSSICHLHLVPAGEKWNSYMWFVVSGNIATDVNLVFSSMCLKAITSYSCTHRRPSFKFCSTAEWE